MFGAGFRDAGFAVRPELDLSEDDAADVFGQVVLAMATGVTFDRLAGIETVRRNHELPDPDGSAEVWTPTGIVMRAVFELLHEPT